MTKKSKMILALASMLGVSAGATAVSGFAWFTTTKKADVNVTNIGVYSKSSNLALAFANGFNCEGSVNPSTGAASIVARADNAITDQFTATGAALFELSKTPYAAPTVTDNDSEVDAANYTWDGKEITFNNAPESGHTIKVTYKPMEVLTDVSSIDGQHIYKPTWAAAYEGIKATAMGSATDGYLSFSLTLTAAGDSGLEVFLNHPTITASTTAGVAANNQAAANIARVAVIDNGTTNFVLQNGPFSGKNNRGISSTDADNSGKNWDIDTDQEGYEGWDLSTGATSEATLLTLTNSESKDNRSSAPDHSDAAKIKSTNYVTSVAANSSKTVTFVVWLEGTSFNTGDGPSGSYASATNPMGGVFDVSLPLIAF